MRGTDRRSKVRAMASESVPRIDAASRVIKASPQTIYQAYIDPNALAVWLPPKGMTARVYAYDPREGGAYHFVLTRGLRDDSARGRPPKILMSSAGDSWS